MRKYLLLHILIISFLIHTLTGCDSSLREKQMKEIEALKQLIRKNPDDAEAHYNLGVKYDSLGMYKEAIDAFKQAIRIDHDYAGAHYNLGLAYGNLGMYKEAIDAFKHAIRINPDDALAHYFLGGSYVSLKDKDSALEQYKILKSLDSELANELFKLINE